MPRGKKRKVVVGRSVEGNNIVFQMYINNHRENATKLKTIKKYCPKARKRVEIKFKDEKHSS
jgi:ribosomal protein L33